MLGVVLVKGTERVPEGAAGWKLGWPEDVGVMGWPADCSAAELACPMGTLVGTPAGCWLMLPVPDV